MRKRNFPNPWVVGLAVLAPLALLVGYVLIASFAVNRNQPLVHPTAATPSSEPSLTTSSEPKMVLPPHATGETRSLGPLTVYTRAGWGALPLRLDNWGERGTFEPQSNPGGVLTYPEPLSNWLRTIVVHHSALPLSDGPFEIQQFHFEERGFADIAYHFVIGPDGAIYEGRPLNVRGAHVGGYNTGSIGIVLMGNFELKEPPPEQVAALEALIDYLTSSYPITHLAGHKDFNPDDTQCPGVNLYRRLPEFAARHNLELGTGGYEIPPWQVLPGGD